jgi:Na+/alanine symporter
MAIPNLIALLLLSGTVTKMVKDYFKEEKAKKSAN